MARTFSLRQLFAACFVIAALVLVRDDGQSFVQVTRSPNEIAGRQFRDSKKQGNNIVTVGSEQPDITSVSSNWVSASLPFVVSVMMGMLVALGGVGAANAEDAPVAEVAPAAAAPAPETVTTAPAATALAPQAATPAPAATAPAPEAATSAPAATAPAPVAAPTPAPAATAAPVTASADSRERALELDADRSVRVRMEGSRERAVELDKERATRTEVLRGLQGPDAVRKLSEAEVAKAEAITFDRARAARVREANSATGTKSSETDQLRARAAAFDLERATRKQAASGDFPKPPPYNAAREAVTEAQNAYFEETIGKATVAENANRAKAAAERDDRLNASAASTAATSLQQQQTMFTEKLKRTEKNQLITERKLENKTTFYGYPMKPFVSPDAMPVEVFAPSLLLVGAFGIAQDIIIKGKQAKEQIQEDGKSLI